MDKPISVGDLVAVVRPNHCPQCQPKSVGRIFRVAAIGGPTSHMRCGCGFVSKMDGYRWAETPEGLSYGLYRLKRIPPLDELEGQKQDEDLREPA